MINSRGWKVLVPARDIYHWLWKLFVSPLPSQAVVWLWYQSILPCKHLASPPMTLSSIHKTWTTEKLRGHQSSNGLVAGPELCMGFKHVNECGRHDLDGLVLHSKKGQGPHKLQIYCHSKEQWNLTIRRFISHYLFEASTVYIERRKQGGGGRKRLIHIPPKSCSEDLL